MKLITHFQDLNSGLKRQGVYLSRPLEGGSEVESSVSEILSQPLRFSLSDLNNLEKALALSGGKLSGTEQNQFQQVVNFHLVRLGNEGSDSVPSRLLFALFRNPNLNQFLSSYQRKAIELKLSKESKTLEKLASKEVEKWTEQDAIALARSYRFVRSRLNTANLTIDEKRRNTGDKLKVYTQNLAKKNTPLSAKEKLFVIEVSRIFDEESDWTNIGGNTYSFVMGKAQNFKQEFIDIVAAPEGRVQAEAKFYWDTLVPVDGEKQPESMTNFLARSAEVESLNAIANKTETPKENIESNKPLILSKVEWDFLRVFSAEEQTTYDFDHGDLTTRLDRNQRENESKQREYQELKQQHEAQKAALEVKRPAAMKADEDLPEDQKSKFDDRWLSADEIDENPVPEGQDPTPKQSLWGAFKEWRAASIEAIFEEKTEAIEEAKKEADKAKADLDRAQEKIDEAEESLQSYKNPVEQAQGLLDQHKAQFKQRLNQGRLVGGDFNFLRHLSREQQVDYLGPAAEQVTGLIDDTRQALSQTLELDLGISLRGEVTESDLATLDEFLSYEAIVKKITETSMKGESSELLNAYNAIKGEKLLDPAQVISAVANQVRLDVLSRVVQPNVRTSGAYNKFLNQYTRQHHNLEKSDRVENLLAFDQQIEKEKKEKINNVYEHAYEKVSALFATAEEPQILAGLNKILKTEVKAGSVLNTIRSYLPEAGFVHNESADTLKNLQQRVVSELSGKVTPENEGEVHLFLVAQDLLNKLDQLQAAENAKLALKNGAKQMEETDSEKLAVTDRLELAKNTKLIQVEVSDINELFQKELENIKTSLERGEDALSLVRAFLKQFEQSYKPRLEFLKGALIGECDLYFGKRTEFSTQLEKRINLNIKTLSSGVSGLEKMYKEGDLDAGDKGYSKLQQIMLMGLMPLFNLHDSKSEEKKIESTLTNVAHTHKYVRDKLGLLQGEGRETATKNYYKQLDEYDKLTSEFKTSWANAKKRLEKDLKSFSEEDFLEKYSVGKSQIREMIKNSDADVEDADTMMNHFSGGSKSQYKGNKNEVFNKWLADYENPEKQPQALHFMDSFRDLENVLGADQEDFAGQTKGLDIFIRDHQNGKGTLWFKKRYKFTIKWYSLTAIAQMVKQSFEAWGKRTERERDRMTAELGSQIWGDTFIGREFDRESNDKEQERVDYWKNSYGSYDIPELKAVIGEVKHINRKDEARAAIELLLESGEIMLDSPIFLDLLGRLQDNITFSQADIDSYVSNTSILRGKVGQAVAGIWDRPTWTNWEKDFKDKYASKMKEFNEDLAAESQTNASDDFMVKALQNWENGTPDNSFFRSKFEQYIFGSFESGFMNGYPGGGDRRFFYLIKGLTTINPNTGEALLNPEALVRLNKLESKYPYLGALDDRNSYKKNGRIVGKDEPGAAQRPWGKEDISAWAQYFDGVSFAEAKGEKAQLATRKWLNECLAPSGDTADRAGKINLRDLDQDDAGMLPLVVNPERMLDVLTLDSGENRPVKGDKYYLNLFTSLEENLIDSVKAMQRVLKHNEPGSDFRKQELIRFGQIIRNYFLMSQTLAGNWDKEHSVGVVTLSDAEWELGNAEKAYEKAVEVTSMLTKNANINRLLKDQRYDDIKVSKNKNAPAEQVEAAALVKTIYEDEIFGDEEALTTFIQEYSEKKGLNL